MDWDSRQLATLGIILSNGESCQAGSTFKANKSHTFDPDKKITRVECIIHRRESAIAQINFYSGLETLVKVGYSDPIVMKHGGRVELFDIDDDEQLIGAELNHGDYKNNGEDHFLGVTWIKCKIAE